MAFLKNNCESMGSERRPDDILHSATKKEEGESMKPTVKSFLALAEDKEQTVRIARFKSASADGYFDEEVFCGKPKDVLECYADEKVTEWATSDNSEIVLYIN